MKVVDIFSRKLINDSLFHINWEENLGLIPETYKADGWVENFPINIVVRVVWRPRNISSFGIFFGCGHHMGFDIIYKVNHPLKVHQLPPPLMCIDFICVTLVVLMHFSCMMVQWLVMLHSYPCTFHISH